MNFVFPIILIISSLAIFFGYVDPNYRGGANQAGGPYTNADLVFLKSEVEKYKAIINSSAEIVSNRDSLIAKKNTISEIDKTKLEKLLPSNIDNIRLIIEISKIAEKRGLIAKNISVGDMNKASDSIGSGNTQYGTLSLRFTVNSSYSNFLNLLKDLESNLRLLDVTDISFNATDSGFYDYNVTLNTYWLK